MESLLTCHLRTRAVSKTGYFLGETILMPKSNSYVFPTQAPNPRITIATDDALQTERALRERGVTISDPVNLYDEFYVGGFLDSEGSERGFALPRRATGLLKNRRTSELFGAGIGRGAEGASLEGATPLRGRLGPALEHVTAPSAAHELRERGSRRAAPAPQQPQRPVKRHQVGEEPDQRGAQQEPAVADGRHHCDGSTTPPRVLRLTRTSPTGRPRTARARRRRRSARSGSRAPTAPPLQHLAIAPAAPQHWHPPEALDGDRFTTNRPIAIVRLKPA